MASVQPTAEDRPFEIKETRVTSETLAELPPASRRVYGKGDLIDGKYELEELIGMGGMGTVWTARNATLGVRRAVKLIRSDAGTIESTDRLLHEAQAAARLADPATVRVFDYGKTAEGDPYIVMELLEGEDLMSIINRRERLSPIKAVRVLLPVIRALGMAHAHGIVHRDLKPENIFLARLPDGRVQPKLLDFGIAKLKDASDLRLTSAGSVVGSPLYMAPEQARGEDVDERADIWALAVVLYEAIAGQPPFGGDDRIQVALAVANHTPEMPRDCGIDAVLWGYLQRGLAKSKEERWPSVDELGRALARWLIDNGVTDDITGASLESGWLRRSRRSLFASSLPPERKSQQGPPSSWQERARGAWSLLIARGEPVRAGWAGLPRAARWGLLGGGVLSVVCVLLLSLGKHDVPAAAQNTTREVPPEAAVPVVESATPPAAASENANASATSTLPAPEPPQPIEPARANSDSAHKAKHASARKRAATKNDSVHDPGRRERRAKLIDPYQ